MQEASHPFDTLSIKVRRLFELWQQTASFFEVTLLNERFVLMTKDMWRNKFSVDRINEIVEFYSDELSIQNFHLIKNDDYATYKLMNQLNRLKN